MRSREGYIFRRQKFQATEFTTVYSGKSGCPIWGETLQDEAAPRIALRPRLRSDDVLQTVVSTGYFISFRFRRDGLSVA